MSVNSELRLLPPLVRSTLVGHFFFYAKRLDEVCDVLVSMVVCYVRLGQSSNGTQAKAILIIFVCTNYLNVTLQFFYISYIASCFFIFALVITSRLHQTIVICIWLPLPYEAIIITVIFNNMSHHNHRYDIYQTYFHFINIIKTIIRTDIWRGTIVK